MNRRRITLDDGRYLIFYTFEEEAGTPSATNQEEEKPAEPEGLVAEAEEERGV